jgi:hypothetical protein
MAKVHCSTITWSSALKHLGCRKFLYIKLFLKLTVPHEEDLQFQLQPVLKLLFYFQIALALQVLEPTQTCAYLHGTSTLWPQGCIIKITNLMLLFSLLVTVFHDPLVPFSAGLGCSRVP